jgi:hypothetical protein
MLRSALLVPLAVTVALGCSGGPCVSACEAHKACPGAQQDDCATVCDAEQTSAERADCVAELDAMFECAERNDDKVCSENVYVTVCATATSAYAACVVGGS